VAFIGWLEKFMVPVTHFPAKGYVPRFLMNYIFTQFFILTYHFKG
jgi:hypothetical protein